MESRRSRLMESPANDGVSTLGLDADFCESRPRRLLVLVSAILSRNFKSSIGKFNLLTVCRIFRQGKAKNVAKCGKFDTVNVRK